MQNIRMLGQHFKFDMDLLSYFPDAKMQPALQSHEIESKVCLALAHSLSKSGHLIMCLIYVVKLYLKSGCKNNCLDRLT